MTFLTVCPRRWRAVFSTALSVALLAHGTAVRAEGDALAAQRADALQPTRLYAAPAALPAGPPGRLIGSEDATADYQLPGGVTARRISYLSRSASGQPVMTTGVILIPFGQPPRGGWPVVAWAHGTAGYARVCAPSLMKDLYYSWEGLLQYPTLGYAVVATDYAGLGGPGNHQYMSLAAQAEDVIAAVSAAAEAVPSLGKRWVAIGHSQGAAAVLKVSEFENGRKDPGFLGVISIAPPTDLSAMWHRHRDSLRGAAGYIGVIALGIRAADPSFDPSVMLGPAVMAKLPLIEKEACLEAAGSLLGAEPAEQLVRQGWADLPQVVAFAARNRPDTAKGEGPILLVQGTGDKEIPEDLTAAAARNLCRQGGRVEYRTYPGLDHDPVVTASLRDQVDWLTDRFAGKPAPSTCESMGK